RRHRLLAGIDEIRIQFIFGGIGTDAEQAVLRLEINIFNIVPNFIGDKCRHADTQVDVHVAFDLLAGPFDDPDSVLLHYDSSLTVLFSMRFSKCSPTYT